MKWSGVAVLVVDLVTQLPDPSPLLHCSTFHYSPDYWGGWGSEKWVEGGGGAEDGVRLHTSWLLPGGVGGGQAGGKVVGGS